MATNDFEGQISATYKALRLGVTLVAVLLPLVLAVGGFARDLRLQGSISAYYHACHPATDNPGLGLMRDVFVGGLFSVAAMLALYRGFSPIEDRVLNSAAVLAVLVALVPMGWPEGPDRAGFSWHGAFAGSFFLCIAFVCIFCASDTLGLIEDEAKRARYRRTYKLTGLLMIVAPLVAFCLRFVAPLKEWTIFFVECAGVYVFAFYWWLKSREVAQTDLDRKVATKSVKLEPRSLPDTLRMKPRVMTIDGVKRTSA